MLPFLQQDADFGNASSKTHTYGMEAMEAVELARRKVAQLLGTKVKEIVWTSGATEANNIALIGTVLASKRKTGRRVLTCTTEHLSVLDPVKSLSKLNVEPVLMRVTKAGLLDLNLLEEELRKGALLTSVMWVNNETGVIQPIAEIANLCKKYSVPLHVDASQAIGKIDVDLRKVPITLLSLSAHKIYGPKGCGTLFVRARTKLEPIMHGGGHENGLRPGTLPVHQLVGLGEACVELKRNMRKIRKNIEVLHEKLIVASVKIEDCRINGSLDYKVPHILNLSFDHIRGSDLLPALAKQFALASGSACTSTKNEASHVLRAMGVTRNLAAASIRISMGMDNTLVQVKKLEKSLTTTIGKLRL